MERIALDMLRLPTSLVHDAWKQRLAAEFTRVGDGTEVTSFTKKLACTEEVKSAAVKVKIVLYALMQVALEDLETPLLFGEMLSSSTVTAQYWALPLHKSPLQRDYEDVLATLAGRHDYVHDILNFALGLNCLLILPQERLAFAELGRREETFPNVSTDVRRILKVMKYARQAVASEVVEKSDYRDLRLGQGQLEVPLRDGARLRHSHPRILKCAFAEKQAENASCAVLFERVYSTGGLSYTFNARPFWSIYRETESARTFFEEIHEKRDEVLEGLPEFPLHSKSYGPRSGLAFFVSFPLSSSPEEDVRTQVAIHEPGEVPDLVQQAVHISPGYVYNIFVTSKQILADQEIGTLPLGLRHCLFPSENSHLELFNNYSKSACEFECHVKNAHDSCGCIPWDYPRLDRLSLPVCNETGTECFKVGYLDSALSAECDCPSSCLSTEYSYTYHSEPLTYTTGLCRETIPRMQFVISLLYGLRPRQENWYQLCGARMLESIALVRISMGSNTFHRITRHKRITFTGQLSSIGKGINITCG